ncbi:MAG TPA: hypothetical protein VMT38_07185, partial [Terracidiphilus sp.]|nr:hypothetical protein [Terracidiphilus sp.]
PRHRPKTASHCSPLEDPSQPPHAEKRISSAYLNPIALNLRLSDSVELVDALKSPVQYSENGEPIAAFDAIMFKLVEKARHGDPHAMRTFLSYAERYGVLSERLSPQTLDISKLTENELRLFEHCLQKMTPGDTDTKANGGAERLISDMTTHELKAEIARREQADHT